MKRKINNSIISFCVKCCGATSYLLVADAFVRVVQLVGEHLSVARDWFVPA